MIASLDIAIGIIFVGVYVGSYGSCELATFDIAIVITVAGEAVHGNAVESAPLNIAHSVTVVVEYVLDLASITASGIVALGVTVVIPDMTNSSGHSANVAITVANVSPNMLGHSVPITKIA